jgi:hypothetical protein
LKILQFIAVFLLVTVTVTVAALTALFTFWSYASVQPGTATALAMLFLVAPGLGLVSGVLIAASSVREPKPGLAAYQLPFAVLGAIVGGLAGYGGAMAAIDLTYTERWSNPASAPAWLPMGPPVAAALLAAVLALLALWFARRRRTA